MRETKLILTEGMPGSGKSTLAHFLRRQLRAHAIAAHWWYEEEQDHPLYIFDDDESIRHVVNDLFSGSHARVISAALKKWRAFAERLLVSGEVGLLDSSLLGYLTWTLFPADLPAGEIHGYVDEVERIIAPLQPALIYLYPEDVGRSLRRICDRRGAEAERLLVQRAAGSPYGKRLRLEGFGGMVALWSAYRSRTDTLFAEAPFQKLAVATDSGTWTTYERQALQFLVLAPVAELRLPEPELRRFAGAYSSLDEQPARICRVSFDHGDLWLDGLPGFWRRSRLIATAPNVFEIDSFPFELRFETKAAGAFECLRIEGPNMFGGGLAGRFTRTIGTAAAG